MQQTADVEYYGSFGDTNEVGSALTEYYWLCKTSHTLIKLFRGMVHRGIYFDWGFGGDFGCQKVTTEQVDLYKAAL